MSTKEKRRRQARAREQATREAAIDSNVVATLPFIQGDDDDLPLICMAVAVAFEDTDEAIADDTDDAPILTIHGVDDQ